MLKCEIEKSQHENGKVLVLLQPSHPKPRDSVRPQDWRKRKRERRVDKIKIEMEVNLLLLFMVSILNASSPEPLHRHMRFK